MGEKMTLEQVRERCIAWIADVATNGSVAGHAVIHIRQMFDNLTQPAQAVDVGALQSLVAAWRERENRDSRGSGEYYSGRSQTYEICADELGDLIAAALPKDSNGAEGADGWRPIATAPKDGKEVLVAFTADGVRQVAEASWSDDEDVWVCSRDGFMLYRRNEPTHWMPLPDAPQEDTPDAAR